MTPPDPHASGNNHIIRLLNIPNFKQLYYQHYKLVRKSNSKFSTCEFLRNCLVQDVIPNTFKIRNRPATFGSTEFQEIWYAESREQSRRWIQNSIDDLNDTCLSLFK